ncbi:zinc dependent phospholipase C family protein [Mucilaginibacter mali]|uniref:Zinc dependent phospholipase C family protein n=1 Tax=Mucilaginibacter mali TaxID=2740462 RepID=A0A7D4Q8N5_9SPHI|nr:zinc dependent phospholipase C family protein [Mucilaginibacter mali]QKJ28984.1 zinc dependent phospholipase C family protein [Mucilaginibacter mali]
MKLLNPFKQYLLTLLFILTFAAPSFSFSILAHEAIIDAEWLGHIRPLLLKKYPGSTDAELDKAHAFAYGGSLVADMGYMPSGCPYFTNLLHYVRSGDMVMALINESQNVNEYAFALGAMSHYMADKYGHALATNVSVPIVYPQLEKKFGRVVTYDNDHSSHSSIEFAYDIIQTYKGNYASTAYHNFTGFEMATPVLERAFLKIYGHSLYSVFPNFQKAINNFRWGVREFFPELARTAWQTDPEGTQLSIDSINQKTFTSRMPKNAFDKQFGKDYDRTGLLARGVVAVINALPKIGPLKKLNFKYPGITAEELYMRSMDSIMVNYNIALQHAAENTLALENIDFDTGNRTELHEYGLADKSYADWILKLQEDHFAHITPAVQKDILAFYSQPNLNIPDNKAREALLILSMIAPK